MKQKPGFSKDFVKIWFYSRANFKTLLTEYGWLCLEKFKKDLKLLRN